MRFSKRWAIISISLIGLVILGWGGYRYFENLLSPQEQLVVERSEQIAKVAPEVFDDYEKSTSAFLALPLTDADKHKIHNLLEPLASWSLMTLGFKQKEVKGRGYAISHIHTLRCLGYAFSDPELKRYMVKIRHRDKIWKPFSQGFVKSLRSKYASGEIQPYLEGFAFQVGADYEKLKGYAANDNWYQFLDALF